jgi:C4-type Zn-finger protein
MVMMTDTLPRVPQRTDALVRCACGGTMGIATVETVPHRLDVMRHTYDCRDCGVSADFVVAKRTP